MSLFPTRRRVLLLLAPLFTAAALAMSCSDVLWDITHGTDRLHARRGDFQAGTTRHPRSWDETLATLTACLGVPNPGVDSVFRGGITIVDDQGYSVFERTHAALFISNHDWDLAGPLGHEMYHGLSQLMPSLRYPTDSLNRGGEFDHAMMMRRPDCVPYCPTAQPGCRGDLPSRSSTALSLT